MSASVIWKSSATMNMIVRSSGTRGRFVVRSNGGMMSLSSSPLHSFTASRSLSSTLNNNNVSSSTIFPSSASTFASSDIVGARRPFSSASVPISSTPEDIETFIQSHKVVLFSKTYCPFCTQSKSLFTQQLKVPDIAIVELDTMGEEGQKIQDTLTKLYGQRTVPFVFVSSTLLGGNTDVQRLAKNGTLQEML